MSERSFRTVVVAVATVIVTFMVVVAILAIDKRHVEQQSTQSYSACELTQGQADWLDCE